MPLSTADDYLIHQIPEPIDTVGTSDRHFYDRYYFNMHASDDSLFMVFGMGQYPNLGVTDAFVSVSHGEVQTTVRASRELGADRMDTAVGPLRVEVIEGLRSLRLVCEPNEWGIALDVTFTASTEALPEPKSWSRVGSRVTQETYRLAHVGNYSGWIEIDGERREVSPGRWAGARDHSWGIRHGIGEPEPKGIGAKRAPDAPMGFFHNWLPIQFDDHMVKITIDNDHAGRRILEEAVLLYNLGDERPPEQLGRPEIDIEYHAGTREVARAELWFSGDGASDLRIKTTPLRTVYLKAGSGYIYDGYWGHGVWQGEQEKVEGVVIEVGEPTDRLEIAWLNETLCRHETDDGRIGYGMHENLSAGLYLPYGFDSLEAVAPT
ncbi:MAG: hypothetical protein IH940_00120 [Acidobacteria bacterium]|nr:hypothetical protein [Acidobacteriota bacterium]